MPSRKPYILLTFANPLKIPAEYLPSLKKESSLVYKHLEKYAVEDQCDVNRISGATVEQIFDTVEKWQLRKDLVIFHFGGHASGEELLLDTPDGNSKSANATGLAGLLGSLPSLKLVFLNGCSTKGQVHLLLEKGVKVVIATSTAIQDKMAVDFAGRFYQNLSQGESIIRSFDRARDFISSEYSYQIQGPRSFRKMTFKKTTEEDKTPWGIYYHEESKDFLNWILPKTRQIKEDGFNDVDILACNRSAQNSLFSNKFMTFRGVKKVQTFFIHGKAKQSPHGLFMRFVFEHIETAYERIFYKIATVNEAQELEQAKTNLLVAIFRAVELEPNHYKRTELTLSNLTKAPALTDVQCVAIKIKVYSSSWKTFTEEFINWFMDELTSAENLPASSPDFIFFFSVIYEEKANSGKPLFTKIFKSSPKEKILKTLRKFNEITILKELPPVELPDIHKWFDRITHDPLEKEEVITRHFHSQKKWDMVRVEKMLAVIINEYNDRMTKP